MQQYELRVENYMGNVIQLSSDSMKKLTNDELRDNTSLEEGKYLFRKKKGRG